MVVLEFNNLERGEPQHSRLLVTNDTVVTLDDAQHMLSHYSVTDETLTVLDHRNKTYTALNTDSAKALSAQLKKQISTVLAGIKALPQEQQAVATERLKSMFGEASENNTPTEFTDTGETGQFAGITCRWYTYAHSGTAPGRACLVAPEALAGGNAILNMLQSMSNIYAILLNEQHAELPLPIPQNPMAPLAAFGQLPIRISEPASGKRQGLEIELLDIKAVSYDPSVLAIPASYTVSDAQKLGH